MQVKVKHNSLPFFGIRAAVANSGSEARIAAATVSGDRPEAKGFL
jgi:hypothetical protein